MPAFLPTLALIVPLALGTPTPSPTDVERAEVARIQRHFDGALAMLDARDISALTADQRARRSALTDVLRAYRDRGRFPRNYDFPGQAMPYFIDRRTGVLCAVAHLMESTGERALVDAVADADNNVWVSELAGNAAFEVWLDENGLTLEEAARIQVPYIGEPVGLEGGSSVRLNTTQTTVALGAAAGTATMMLFAPKLNATRTGALITFAAGTLAMATSVHGLANGVDSSLGYLTIGTGVLNYYLSGRSLGRYRAAERTRRANIAPIIPTTREQGAGIMLSLTF